MGAKYALPYGGAKKMLLVKDTENKAYLAGLLIAMIEELPEPKKRGNASGALS